MSNLIQHLDSDEAFRNEAFPVTANRIFLGHAGITVLPRCVAKAMQDYTESWCVDYREWPEEMQVFAAGRKAGAAIIGAQPEEIALLGPTTLGIALIANGLTWEPGDEIICYRDDYPANVYPWQELESLHGVVIKYIEPETPGHITPDHIAALLSPKTKLCALASCHFLTGWRIDVDAIGQLLHANNVLFSLDAIQTIGAFETNVRHVDFLSADSHKWMLGPMTAGIVYVKKEHFEKLRPTLLGAWNVHSPNFVTQDKISLVPTAQRYEPGVLNTFGLVGMTAALDMLLDIGIENVSAKLLRLKKILVAGLEAKGFQITGPQPDDALASSITTCTAAGQDMDALFEKLNAHQVTASLRHNRAGTPHLRFAPHFYNTEAEMQRVLDLL